MAQGGIGMLRERLITIGCAVLMSILLMSCGFYWLHKKIPPKLAMIDFAQIIKEQEAQFSRKIKTNMSSDERAQLLQSVAHFGNKLSNAIDTLSLECNCVLLNKAAILGKPAIEDLTLSLKAKVTQ